MLNAALFQRAIVMLDAVVTFVCRCLNSEGEDSAENEQLDGDVNATAT